MTCEPGNNCFRNAFPLATLVLVDMRKANLLSTQGLTHAEMAGILTNCRGALAYARKMGFPIAFVRGAGDSRATNQSNEWIKGFEPQRLDAIFDRRGASCYSSPYFADGMRETGGAVVLAGFLGRGGCLSTGADALLAGNHITFLSDATKDDVSDRALNESAIGLLRAFTSFDIRVLSTGAWIRSVEEFPISIEEPVRRGDASSSRITR
ncbi:MAG: isochorismatase family protein [Alphaproteobacteria bacterium]|nr:isochorismatase family protein [Alphaproteobacteria bacterium]